MDADEVSALYPPGRTANSHLTSIRATSTWPLCRCTMGATNAEVASVKGITHSGVHNRIVIGRAASGAPRTYRLIRQRRSSTARLFAAIRRIIP